MNNIFKYIKSIPENMCSELETKFLYDLAMSLPQNATIVEIGTCAGKSTISLGYAQKQKGGKAITTIDIKEHKNLEKHLKEADVIRHINRIIDNSANVSTHWVTPIDLLWIDGDHRFKGVEADIKNWSNLVVPGGFMAFHDYPAVDDCCYEVWKAVYKHILSKPDEWRVYSDREAVSIIVFQKIDPSKSKRLQRIAKMTKKQKKAKKWWWFKQNLKWLFKK